MRSFTPPAPLLAIGGIVSVQFGAALATTLIARIGAPGTVTLRLGLGVLVLFAVARPRVRGRSRRDWAAVAGFGVTLALMNLSFYQALDRLSLGVAVTIEFVGPLGLAAATSRRGRDFAWIGLAALGIVLLTPEIGSTLDPIGVALAGVTGLCWAAFTVMSQRIGRALPGNSGLAIAMLVAALGVTISDRRDSGP
jgi:inner membrane transporter RhtA